MYKVIIIEDENLIRKALIYSFNWQELNCNIIGEAQDGLQGEQLIKSLKPDIVITDINMPIKNGIEVLKATTDLNYAAIIISGYEEFEYAKEAIKYGISDYLLKPIDHQELKLAVLKAIEKIKMQQSYSNKLIENKQLKEIKVLEEHQKNTTDKTLEIIQTINFINEHYHEKIVIEDLTRMLKCSASFLNYKFKEEIGTTFADYLNRYRILKAIEFIKLQKYPLYEIATMCGFKDYKYFNQVFHKYVGTSVKDFKQLVI